MSDCKRSCGCWTPWSVCARQRRCACHVTQEMKDKALQALRDEQQQARLRAAAAVAGNPRGNQ